MEHIKRILIQTPLFSKIDKAKAKSMAMPTTERNIAANLQYMHVLHTIVDGSERWLKLYKLNCFVHCVVTYLSANIPYRKHYFIIFHAAFSRKLSYVDAQKYRPKKLQPKLTCRHMLDTDHRQTNSTENIEMFQLNMKLHG